MKIEATNSKTLKASDLNGREVRVTMSHVERQEFKNRETGGIDRKYVLFFEGKEKGLVLNKINTNTIIDYYGDESDAWAGKQIILYETTAEYQGKRSPAIRIKVNPNHVTQAQVAAPQRPAPAAAPAASTYKDTPIEEDSVPF